MTALLARTHAPLVLLAAGILLDNPWPQLRQVRPYLQPLQVGAPGCCACEEDVCLVLEALRWWFEWRMSKRSQAYRDCRRAMWRRCLLCDQPCRC